MPKQNRQPGIHLHKTIKYKEKKIKGTSIHQKSIPYSEYYWILIARNGKTIARSSETYKRKGSAVRSIVVAEEIFNSKGYYYDHTTGGVGVETVNTRLYR